MALISCVECGKIFSDKAAQCPECGCPVQYSTGNSASNSRTEERKSNSIVNERQKILDRIMKKVNETQCEGTEVVSKYKIDDWEFEYSDSDRLFSFLYNTFHHELDEVINNYEKTFKLEVKAVSLTEILMTETALTAAAKSNGEVDADPFASRFIDKIEDYRYEKKIEEESAVCIDYQLEDAFEKIEQILLKELCTEQKIAPSINVCRELWKLYLKQCYKDLEYVESNVSDYEMYVNANYDKMHLFSLIQDKYILTSDCLGLDESPFEKYTDFYSKNNDDVVKQAWDEIKWRKKYFEKPDNYKLWEKIAIDVERMILFIIKCLDEKCNLGINPTYYNWENYTDIRNKKIMLDDNIDEDRRKDLLKDCFLGFPFLSDLYPYMLDMYGTQNGEMEKLLEQFNVNVEALRDYLFHRCVNNAYENVNWKNVDVIMEAYNTIKRKEELLQYRGDLLEKQKKIYSEYGVYKEFDDFLNENSILGLKKLCSMLESEIGLNNDRVSDKLKKGLNIEDGVEIYFAHDDSLLKNGKSGFAITNKGIYVREALKKTVYYNYNDLPSNPKQYKIWNLNVMVNDGVLFYYTGDKRILNKLYMLAKNLTNINIVNDTENQLETVKKYCAFCGKKFDVSAKFCPFCGEKNIYIEN